VQLRCHIVESRQERYSPSKGATQVLSEIAGSMPRRGKAARQQRREFPVTAPIRGVRKRMTINKKAPVAL
jgi:hypothetical protein